MFKVLASTWPLLLGVMLLMVGNGMQGSLLGIRGGIEGFTTFQLSVVMSAYFLGFLADGPVHGYVLRRRVAQLSGYARPVSDGSLYPAIDRLVKR